jgi:hypothetical protein
LLGIKGGQEPADYYSCDEDFSKGDHTMSVVYDPSNAVLFAAWEDGTGAKWRPAACNAYLKLDLSKWFSTTAVLTDD